MRRPERRARAVAALLVFAAGQYLCGLAVAGVTAAGIRESHKHDATVRPEAGTAAPDVSADGGSRSFFKDFREGWSWSLHRTMLVMTISGTM